MIHDTIVIGAGVAGLAAARELRARGQNVLVLERARGVGGRCATRRIDGQAVDHGLPFLHGRGERFLAELDAMPDADVVPGWPRVVDGDGLPCRPEAFTPADRRVALREGVSRFAKHLAGGLDVRLGAEVVAMAPSASGDCWALRLAGEETWRARSVALTMPAPSARALLERIERLPEPIASLLPAIDLVRWLPCLAVIARYRTGTPAPAWDVSLPRASRAIHSILHDSSKRGGTPRLTLVIQARPRFSADHLAEPPESWTRTLLDEAGDLHGRWTAEPELVQAHAWRKARVAPGSELARPLVVRLESGIRLGIAGDGFHDAGGAEGAYRSGLALAERFAESPPGPA